MIRLCAEATPTLGYQWLNHYRGKKPLFVCVLSFTRTALHPNISAAGKTPQARLNTAAADGEYLLTGTHLPDLPAGVSPALIARAILVKQSIDCQLVSTGLPTPLTVPHLSVAHVIAEPVQSGQAMSIAEVDLLFQVGKELGHRLASRCLDSYLIIGECVVGGTTTAQAVLTGLGYSVAHKMGSSLPLGNHSQKRLLVDQGLTQWQQRQPQASVLELVAAVGDPMQVIVAAAMLTASQVCGVLLAGGSQMLAVYALGKALAQEQQIAWRTDQIAVGTTRWVIEDPSADTAAIARQTGATYLASEIDFSQSPYAKLRAYEQGFVKEGVGAGGIAIAAHLYGNWTRSQLRHAVEAQLRSDS